MVGPTRAYGMSAGSAASALPRRPVLVGLYHAVILDDDRVQIANAGRAVVLKGRGFGTSVTPLLEALDGRTALDDVIARFPDLAPQVLRGLAEKGLLSEAAEDPDTAISAPGLAALAFPAGPSPAEAAHLLAQATVAVVGRGPVVAASAILLGKAGLGRVLVLSSGEITSRDVAVSPVLTPADRGQPRAHVIYEHCREMGIQVEEVNGEWPDRLRENVTLALVERSYDGESAYAAAAEAALDAGTTFLSYSQDALEAVIGPLVVPGGSPCHRCLESRLLSHEPHLEEHLAYRRHRARVRPEPDAFLAAQSSMLAGLVATEVLRAVLGADPQTAGAVLLVGLASGELRRENLLSVPGCPGCRKVPQPESRTHQ